MVPTHRAVCFDLDGVLIDTMQFHAQAWMAAARACHLKVRNEEIYQWEGEPGMVTARRLLRRSGRSASVRSCGELLQAKECRFSSLGRKVSVRKEWVRLLERLRKGKVRLALVTGTSESELRRVLPTRVLQRFAAVITGDRVNRGKPHPEPYRRSFKLLRVKPSQAVVVENAPYGIRSAKAAGAGLVIALTSSLPARYLRGADRIVESCAQLQAALAEVINV